MASPAQAQLPVQPKPLWTRIDDLASMMSNLQNSIKTGVTQLEALAVSASYTITTPTVFYLSDLLGVEIEYSQLILGAHPSNGHNIGVGFGTYSSPFSYASCVVFLGAGQWWVSQATPGTFLKASRVQIASDPAAGDPAVNMVLQTIFIPKVS